MAISRQGDSATKDTWDIMRIPIKLGRDTIAESIFELRFVPDKEPAFELLLGFMYSNLQAEFANVIQLPIMQLPRNIIESDPNLMYQPLNRLDSEHYGISIGRRSVAVHAKYPYQGWAIYRPLILRVVELLKKTNVVGTIERFSLKYLNILPNDVMPEGIDALKVNLNMGHLQYKKTTVQIRTEIEKGPTITIAQILTGASVLLTTHQENIVGTLVDIDTVFMKIEGDFWASVENNLDLVHSTEKEIFFNLLQERALAKLKPEYPQ